MCHKKFLHLFVLHCLPRITTTSPGGGTTGLLQSIVAAAVCSIPGRNTVDYGVSGVGMVAAFGGAL